MLRKQRRCRRTTAQEMIVKARTRYWLLRGGQNPSCHLTQTHIYSPVVPKRKKSKEDRMEDKIKQHSLEWEIMVPEIHQENPTYTGKKVEMRRFENHV